LLSWQDDGGLMQERSDNKLNLSQRRIAGKSYQDYFQWNAKAQRVMYKERQCKRFRGRVWEALGNKAVIQSL
jgi:hypothetical protein